jgi:hypothetical protein
MRYADVILMKAEAAAHLNKDAEAQTLVNQIRARALKSTHTKGSSEGKNEYVKYAAADLQGKLPNITATGAALLDAILHERRVEFGMEGIRYLDLVRTGKYLGSLSTTVKTSCQSHCITEGLVNPMPVLPIPLNEAQSWNLAQNPNY